MWWLQGCKQLPKTQAFVDAFAELQAEAINRDWFTKTPGQSGLTEPVFTDMPDYVQPHYPAFEREDVEWVVAQIMQNMTELQKGRLRVYPWRLLSGTS